MNDWLTVVCSLFQMVGSSEADYHDVEPSAVISTTEDDENSLHDVGSNPDAVVNSSRVDILLNGDAAMSYARDINHSLSEASDFINSSRVSNDLITAEFLPRPSTSVQTDLEIEHSVTQTQLDRVLRTLKTQGLPIVIEGSASVSNHLDQSSLRIEEMSSSHQDEMLDPQSPKIMNTDSSEMLHSHSPEIMSSESPELNGRIVDALHDRGKTKSVIHLYNFSTLYSYCSKLFFYITFIVNNAKGLDFIWYWFKYILCL